MVLEVILVILVVLVFLVVLVVLAVVVLVSVMACMVRCVVFHCWGISAHNLKKQTPAPRRIVHSSLHCAVATSQNTAELPPHPYSAISPRNQNLLIFVLS